LKELKEIEGTNPYEFCDSLEESELIDLNRNLTFQKVIPRIDLHNYKEQQFYIYCYLDPFDKKTQMYKIGNKKVMFGYRPIYIGKATGKGYRHHQHLIEFAKSKYDVDEKNDITFNKWKIEAFKKLEFNMKNNKNMNLPSDWKDYKDNWIVLLEEAFSQQDLQQLEKEYINGIGTLKKNTGLLTNATFG